MSSNTPRGGFQTKATLRGLLDAAGLRPRHRLGQCFLIDRNLMHKLIDAAEIGPRDCILEVGPGAGSLTSLLADRAGHVVSVEVDHRIVEAARQWLSGATNVSLLVTDVLAKKSAIDPQVIEAIGEAQARLGGAIKLVANLPYDVATPLLINLMMGEQPFERMCFTVQAEVADRLLAEPDTSDYGPVGILTKLMYDGSRVAKLPPAAFWPAPKVHSTMVRLDRRPAPHADPAGLMGFIRPFFQHRRKTLQHTAASLGIGEQFAAALEELSLSPQARPAEITPDQWSRLYATST